MQVYNVIYTLIHIYIYMIFYRCCFSFLSGFIRYIFTGYINKCMYKVYNGIHVPVPWAMATSRESKSSSTEKRFPEGVRLVPWLVKTRSFVYTVYIYIYPSSPPLFKQRGRDVDLLLQTTTIFQVDCSGWQRGEAILAPGQCKALKGLLWHMYHMFWSTLSCIRSSMFKTHDGLIEIWNRDTVPRTDNGTDKWEKWYITYPTVDAMGLTCHEASLGNPLIA